MTSGRRCRGRPGTLTDAAGPGTRQELRGSSRKNGLGAPMGGKRGPTSRMGRKGSRSPQGLPSGRCPPQCRRKGDSLRESSAAWERRLAALPSWSWGRPQGRAGGWHEGGRICGGESCRLSGGRWSGATGRRLLQPCVSPGHLAGKALLSLGNEGWGRPLPLSNSKR